MKKIKLLTGLFGITGLSMGLVPVITLTSCHKTYVILDESVTSKGVSVKSANVQKDKESTIELQLPSGKHISAIELQIGDTTLNRSDVIVSGGKITIQAKKMVANTVIIKSISLYTPTPGPTPEIGNCVTFENKSTTTDASMTIGHCDVSSATMEFFNSETNEWEETRSTETYTIAKNGGKFYLRGKGFEGEEAFDIDNGKHIIIATGEVSLSGTVDALVNWEKTREEITYGNYGLWGAFQDSTGIKSVPSGFLPAESITRGCYNSMFANCSNLTSAPKLPATSLPEMCYKDMFYGCTSLKIKEVDSKGEDEKFIFSCPNPIGGSKAVYRMFYQATKGSFTGGTPNAGKSYYYED